MIGRMMKNDLWQKKVSGNIPQVYRSSLKLFCLTGHFIIYGIFRLQSSAAFTWVCESNRVYKTVNRKYDASRGAMGY